MTLAPDDVRHGTWRGYARGCRADDCGCRADHTRRRNLLRSYYRRTGHGLMIDSLYARRRVQALQWLGWSLDGLSRRMGRAPSWLGTTLKSDRIRRSSHRAIDAVYRELCMTFSDEPRAEKTRRRARERGYWPPLAWLDIDDPDEDPESNSIEAAGEGGHDWAVVARVLGGDKMPTTAGEREAVWRARDWDRGAFERLTGGNAHRMTREHGPPGADAPDAMRYA